MIFMEPVALKLPPQARQDDAGRLNQEKFMDMQAITEALRAKVGQDSGLGAVLKFDCGEDGVAVIDGKNVPNSVSNADCEADCTVAITRDNLAALVSGALNPMNGFMMGKFKVSGDMSVAMKLSRVV
jgi:putative sterol carrier protein